MSSIKNIFIKDAYNNLLASGAITDIKISNFKISLSFITSFSNANSIEDNIYPGKYKKLDLLFERPYYIDTTYNSGNTLKIGISGVCSDIWNGGDLIIDSYEKTPIGRPASQAIVSLTGYEYIPL